MNTETMKPNVQPMSSAPMLNDSYMQTKKAAFAFGTAKEKLQKLIEKRNKIFESMTDKEKEMKGKAFIYLFIAIILAILEGVLCMNSIAAVTGLPQIICVLEGTAFCMLGIGIGDYMANNVKKDPLTGKRIYTGKFWLGVLLGVAYCSLQYFLVSKSGGINASAEIQDTINTMKIIVVSICLIEIIVGYVYMPATHKALSLWFNNQLCKLGLKRKNKAAQHTDESWVRYQFDCQAYNTTYGTNMPCAEETPLIQEARTYYNDGYGEQENV